MTSRNVQKGVGLTEVMVALLLLSVAVLGFIGLQVRASGAGNEAFARTQAMAIAQDLAERVRLNIDQIAAYTTAANWASASNKTACETATCDAVARDANPGRRGGRRLAFLNSYHCSRIGRGRKPAGSRGDNT